MQNYIDQLLADIAYATENVSLPFIDTELHLHDWMTNEEEGKQLLFVSLKNGLVSIVKCFRLLKC